MTKLFDANVLKAAYHALRCYEDGPLIFRDEHYDRMIRDIARQEDGQDDDAERLSLDSNGYDQ